MSPEAAPLSADDAAVVLGEALRRGGSWAEVFAERRDTQTVRLDGGWVAEVRSDRDAGAGVRVVANGRTGFAYTNVLTRPALTEAARAAAAAALGGESREDGEMARVDLCVTRAPRVQRAGQAPAHDDTAATIALLRAADEAARARSGEVRSANITHVGVTQDVLVATTDGEATTDTRVRSRITCRVHARRDGRLETGFCGPGGGRGSELFTDRTPASIGAEAADRALRALDGADPPRGVMPVVLGASGGGLLLHEACGHGLEGDGLSRSSSVFASTHERLVGSRLVTAVDDPSLDLAYGAYGVDDEGTPVSPTTLVAEGVQVGALTDRATAGLLGRPRSGNGRRESYAHPPVPRMSNTYIAAGTDAREEIVGGVDRGVYVVALKGGDVDVTTGQFAFAAGEAYLIEHGRVTRPLAGLTLLGNGPAVLASVEAVGDDLAFTEALCGKEGQWVPVSYGSPTLLVGGLTVSGRQS